MTSSMIFKSYYPLLIYLAIPEGCVFMTVLDFKSPVLQIIWVVGETPHPRGNEWKRRFRFPQCEPLGLVPKSLILPVKVLLEMGPIIV